jgi:hypothetical protein
VVSLEDTLEEEQTFFKNIENRINILKSIEDNINALILEIFKVQSLMINLKLAFFSHVLPEGWELRVATDTGVPYWVNIYLCINV